MADYKELYQEYLESPEWDALRKEAYKRAKNRCELCDDHADAAHHIKYPKSFEDDCLENLLVVCDRCHKKLHGIKPETLVGITYSETIFLIKLMDKVTELFKNSAQFSLKDLEAACLMMGIDLISKIKQNMFRIN